MINIEEVFVANGIAILMMIFPARLQAEKQGEPSYRR